MNILETSIYDLKLSVRAYNALKTLGVTTLGQVARLQISDFCACKNFGKKTLEEIERLLAGYGLELGDHRTLILDKWLQSPIKAGVKIQVPDISKIDTLTLIALNSIIHVELKDRAEKGKL